MDSFICAHLLNANTITYPLAEKQEASWYRYKTLLYWDSVSLVYGKDHATGEATRIAAESSREMGREESSTKESLMHWQQV
jgi:hypothetical protein